MHSVLINVLPSIPPFWNWGSQASIFWAKPFRWTLTTYLILIQDSILPVNVSSVVCIKQTHKLIIPCANLSKCCFSTNKFLLPLSCLIFIYIKQSDMCPSAALWDKHQLPETEILIWCHAVSILAPETHTYVYPYLLSQNTQRHAACMVLWLRHYKWPH